MYMFTYLLYYYCCLCMVHKHIKLWCNCVDRLVFERTTVTGGCIHVNISWTTIYSTDDCNVLYYNVTLSYVTMNDHVTVSMVNTMNSSTITGLPDDTQVNITVTVIGVMQIVLLSQCVGGFKEKAGQYGSYYPADKLFIPHSKLFT